MSSLEERSFSQQHDRQPCGGHRYQLLCQGWAAGEKRVFHPMIHIREGVTEGRVIAMGVVVGKLRHVQFDLVDPSYELAVKAYQARLPILCQGDLIEQGGSFRLQHPQDFRLALLQA